MPAFAGRDEKQKRNLMVIALDKNKKPVGFITEKRFRILCEKKCACLYRVYQTVGILMDVDARETEDLPTYRIKIDPGFLQKSKKCQIYKHKH